MLGATETVPLVYDFGGFEHRFYQVRYRAPGAPWLADRIVRLMPDTERVGPPQLELAEQELAVAIRGCVIAELSDCPSGGVDLGAGNEEEVLAATDEALDGWWAFLDAVTPEGIS